MRRCSESSADVSRAMVDEQASVSSGEWCVKHSLRGQSGGRTDFYRLFVRLIVCSSATGYRRIWWRVLCFKHKPALAWPQAIFFLGDGGWAEDGLVRCLSFPRARAQRLRGARGPTLFRWTPAHATAPRTDVSRRAAHVAKRDGVVIHSIAFFTSYVEHIPGHAYPATHTSLFIPGYSYTRPRIPGHAYPATQTRRVRHTYPAIAPRPLVALRRR